MQCSCKEYHGGEQKKPIIVCLCGSTRFWRTFQLRKIDLADEVLILDVDGYIGESMGRELAYAKAHGKRVRYWSQEQPPQPAAGEGESA